VSAAGAAEDAIASRAQPRRAARVGERWRRATRRAGAGRGSAEHARKARRRAVWALLLAACAFAPLAPARVTPRDLPAVALAELPREASTVMARIRAGGPFRYERDGVVFANRERILPAKPRGYYHEYTVPTAGARDRGARRIVCGGPRRTPDACYYTDDHYGTFRRIRE
jgi:ribonuclease T1